MKTKRKKPTHRIAHKRAEKVFNLWIRLSNADINGNCKCFTCDAAGHYKTVDAGHFIANKLDFHEHNKHPQCVKCNRWLHGNLIEYTLRMITLYGEEYVNELRRQATQIKKYSVDELLAIEKEYKQRIKEIENKA